MDSARRTMEGRGEANFKDFTTLLRVGAHVPYWDYTKVWYMNSISSIIRSSRNCNRCMSDGELRAMPGGSPYIPLEQENKPWSIQPGKPNSNLQTVVPKQKNPSRLRGSDRRSTCLGSTCFKMVVWLPTKFSEGRSGKPECCRSSFWGIASWWGRLPRGCLARYGS